MQILPPALQLDLFRPGQRIAVAVSGGADSVALLRCLLEQRLNLGVVLSVVHVHHGIRGVEADDDATFVASLARDYDLQVHLHYADAPAAAALNHETLEEAARKLRYAFFNRLIAENLATAVATAHTLDDQAETVLAKFLRGAWTDGLSGIHPVLPAGQGSIVRPFLEATRIEIERWLCHRNQTWREDSSNRDSAHTRNRIRHELLPLLRSFNPEIARQLSRLAAISADEELYWQREMARLLPSLLLPGKPSRGGGRSAGHSTRESIAIDRMRLAQLHPAAARRVLRGAARQLGARLNFDHTERLMALAASPARGSRIELPAGVVAEHTLRELRFMRAAACRIDPPGEYRFSIPGEVNAPEYGLLLRGELVQSTPGLASTALLRNWKAGDRITLRHSRGPKRVKEVLDRIQIRGSDREVWPVVEVDGKIVWMRGAEIDAPEFIFTAHPMS